MKGRKLDFFKSVELLKRKSDCIISGNTIKVNMGITKRGKKQKKNDLGIKSWGRIDFLVNHMGFSIEKLPEF